MTGGSHKGVNIWASPRADRPRDGCYTMLLVLLVTSGSATRAAARASPGEQPAALGGSTNNALPPPTPPRSSAVHGRGLHRLLAVEENKSGAGPSCGTHDKNKGCPPSPH